MAQSDAPPPGPDLAGGVPLSEVPLSGVLAGHVDGAPVLLARLDDGIFAVGGTCTHYGAPLAEGLVAGDEIRCPWHHACFSLRTGRALKAPAFAALPTWRVDIRDGKAFVVAARDAADTQAVATDKRSHPQRIVIVGGGAAAFSAADRLRNLGFAGSLAMLSADDAPPCDRPNLSKDYLAGTAQADWIPLQDAGFYADRKIDLRLGCEVVDLETGPRNVVTASGERLGYDALLIATGAEPARLPTAGFALPNVFTLRTLADADAVIAATAGAKSVALVGAGFIGLEAAAALRTRGLDVHVVARDEIPMQRVLGRELGGFLLQLHQQHGVVFHLQASASGFDGKTLTLDGGTQIPADLLIVGVGVSPRTRLASAAGLDVEDGILVDGRLRTSMPGIFAAGDVARYPHGAGRARIEHWVHAERQGQVAAANMLGGDVVFDEVPFFWTHHYGVELRYVGHARRWDEISVDGDLDAHDATARFFRDDKLLAAASIGRDLESLAIEDELRA